MLELTETARKELEAYFAENAPENIRIYLTHGGCSGPRLALALDKPGADDVTVQRSGFSFCINGDLLKKVDGVTIDLGGRGFEVRPFVPLSPVGASSCSGCSGGCNPDA